MTVQQLIEALQQLPPHYLVVHNAIDTGDICHIDSVELDHDGLSPVVSMCYEGDGQFELSSTPPNGEGWYWYQEQDEFDLEPALIRFDESIEEYVCLNFGQPNWKILADITGKWSTKSFAIPMDQ